MRGITSLATLGAAIRGSRRRAGMTQVELAARARLSRATVIALESGSPVEASTVLAAAKALDLELALVSRASGARSGAIDLSLLDDTEEL